MESFTVPDTFPASWAEKASRWKIQYEYEGVLYTTDQSFTYIEATRALEIWHEGGHGKYSIIKKFSGETEQVMVCDLERMRMIRA